MNLKIDERLEGLLGIDKFLDPQHLCDVLEEEFSPIAQNYLVLEGNIKVRFKKQNNRKIFFVEMVAERIKPFGYLPQ